MDRLDPPASRRQFLKASAAAATLPLFARPAAAAPAKTSAAETAVKALYDTLTPEQRKVVCFGWDHTDKRGLLRTHVSNNWQITEPKITAGNFYTKAQQGIARDIFHGLINPEWKDRFLTQLEDDAGGPWGSEQSFAIFGEPGTDTFEFVLTGRHQTLRADGNTQSGVAFGGPIFYGHAAEGFNEKKNHPGNVFWPQAVAANKVYAMLSEKQRQAALAEKSPKESAVAFRGKKVSDGPGLPASDLSRDQKDELQKVLAALVDPFRVEDRDEALAALKTQGGLDACVLTYFADKDIGNDKVWDNWRLEGPSFVWYFRGSPHVHVWVNVADDAGIKTNAAG
ncbi:MAG: DUF3500 domain-containing protein [Fimbriiglobus sp.]